MRNRNLLIIASLATVFTFSALSYTGASSNQTGVTTVNQHQRVDGMDVYYGIVPTADAEGQQPPGHSGAPLPPGDHYLTVSLIDSRTGQHIPDAKVSALVGRGFTHREESSLSPATINNLVSYGNYFTMVRPGTYRIKVSIQRPGAHTQTANFSYQQL